MWETSTGKFKGKYNQKFSLSETTYKDEETLLIDKEKILKNLENYTTPINYTYFFSKRKKTKPLNELIITTPNRTLTIANLGWYYSHFGCIATALKLS